VNKTNEIIVDFRRTGNRSRTISIPGEESWWKTSGNSKLRLFTKKVRADFTFRGSLALSVAAAASEPDQRMLLKLLNIWDYSVV